MSEASNWHRATPLQASKPAIESLLPPLEARQNRTRKLVQPHFIERLVFVADIVLIVVVSLACSVGYHFITEGVARGTGFGGVGLIAAVNFTTIMATQQHYRLKNLADFAKQARSTVLVWLGVILMLIVVAFTMKISREFSRGTTLLFAVGGLSILLFWRLAVARLISLALATDSFAKRKIILIGEQNLGTSSRSLTELLRLGYSPVRICEITREEIASQEAPQSFHAKLANVIELAKSEHIDDVYLALSWRNQRTIDEILDKLAVLPISVHLVPDESVTRFMNYPVATIGGTWTSLLRRAPLNHVEQMAKRLFDVLLATAALLTMLPLLLVISVLIKLDSRGPVLFRQKRNGFNGEAFDIFKFRTMYVQENDEVVVQATRNDPRVTPLGRWLRKSSIDELPQLLNVIRGEMSLVGPRPHAESHNTEYAKLISNYAFRHHVKPGLTGWAQVNGYRGETHHIEQMERRVEHDIWYINNWSPWLDLKILFKTVLVAFRQTSAY